MSLNLLYKGSYLALIYIALISIAYPIIIEILKHKLSNIKSFIFTYLLAIYLPLYIYSYNTQNIAIGATALIFHGLGIYMGLIVERFRYSGFISLIPISLALINETVFRVS